MSTTRSSAEQSPAARFRAVAPGRVNLIGDHTDYMGGSALPMAVQLQTTIAGNRTGPSLELESAHADEMVRLDLPVQLGANGDDSTDADRVAHEGDDGWGRFVAAAAAVTAATTGITDGRVDSTVPLGAGMSSSAALSVALVLALGDPDSAEQDATARDRDGALDLARLAQRVEHLATGVPCGLMDQLASVAGRHGHAVRIDFASLTLDHVPVPDDARIWVVHSGEQRRLSGSAYADRRAQCEAAEALVGALPAAAPDRIEQIDDPALRARARHVRSECERVEQFAVAFAAGDLRACGALMSASHRSLRDDFAVSTPRLDELVDHLESTDGVFGARLTGAGFGGCVVALARPGVELAGWSVTAADGASVEYF